MPTRKPSKRGKTTSSNTRTLGYTTTSNKAAKAKTKSAKKAIAARPKSFASLSTAQKNKVARKNKRTATKQMGTIAKSIGSRARGNPASEMAAKRAKMAVSMEAGMSGAGGGYQGKPSRRASEKWTKKLKKAGLSTGKSGSGITRPSGQSQKKRKTVKNFKKSGLSRGKK